MNQLRIYAILATGLLLGAAAPLQAQVTTATIYGNVTDASGAPLRDAQIEVRNDATGATLAATTNDEGEFTFTFLPIGRYSLAIKATGFKTQSQPNVEVSAGERLRLNYALEV